MNKNDVELALRDYHWIPKEIERLEKALGLIDLSITAPYGIEASLPKPQGVNGDKVGKTVIRKSIREEKQSKILSKLRFKVSTIDSQIDRVSDDRTKAVFLCLLEGMTQTQISLHLRLAEGKVSRIKSDLVTEIYDNLKSAKRTSEPEENEENESFEGNKEKCSLKK